MDFLFTYFELIIKLFYSPQDVFSYSPNKLLETLSLLGLLTVSSLKLTFSGLFFLHTYEKRWVHSLNFLPPTYKIICNGTWIYILFLSKANPSTLSRSHVPLGTCSINIISSFSSICILHWHLPTNIQICPILSWTRTPLDGSQALKKILGGALHFIIVFHAQLIPIQSILKLTVKSGFCI